MLDSESCSVPAAGRQLLQCPTFRFRGVNAIGDENCRNAWSQRNIELIEREGQAFAARLDVRFLACPAVKKCCGPKFMRDLSKCKILCARKEMFGNFIAGEFSSQKLDINADLSAPRDGYQSHLVR